MKKFLSFVLALVMALALVACGQKQGTASGRVFWLNFKPEADASLQKIAEMYTKETGVPVTVQTAASGTYNETLTSAMDKEAPPTLFVVGNQAAVGTWGDYCYDLTGTKIAGELNTDAYNLYDANGKLCSIGYCYECFGIIVNKKLINEYAKKDYAVIKSFDDIKDYNTLKKVADSMQQHKDDLGIDGAFSTPGLDSSNYYRYASHMTQVPVAYEYIDEGVDFEKELKGTYLDNYKNLWDLEMKDNPTENTMLGSVNYEDSTAEFSAGKVAFYPNGVWAYSQIKGNEVADEDLAMLPYYMGFPNESKYAANSIYDISWSVNKNASDKDKKATEDFIKWMVSDEDAKKILSKDMGFAVPFTTFDSEDFQPDNPLTKSALKLESDGLTPIHGAYIPGQAWADGVANALLEYAQGTGDWNGVKKAYLDDWTSAWNDYENNFGMLPPAHK